MGGESILVRSGPIEHGAFPPQIVEDEAAEAMVSDDYVVTVAGSCWVQSVRIEADGTHVITVKGRGAEPPADAPVLVTYDRLGRCVGREGVG